MVGIAQNKQCCARMMEEIC